MNREDFPLLADGKWASLDNAATTPRPQPVLDALAEAAVTCNANVHRSPHGLGREMTRRFEEARDKVGRFFGAGENYTVVFTSGATGAINLVAHSYLEAFCQPGDRILTLGSEHHSNFVPWQQLWWCPSCPADSRTGRGSARPSPLPPSWWPWPT